MKKKKLEVIKGVEKLNNNTLEHVKGGISTTPEEEKCCDIQFSCNNKGDKGKSKEELQNTGAQSISVL